MSRSTQFIGLNDKALEFLNNNCKCDVIDVYRNGVLESSYAEPRKIEGEVIFGMFGEPIQLYNYITHDGTILYEQVQCEYWSSGPVIFTFLTKKSDKCKGEYIIGGWEDKEIEEMV